MITYNDSVMLSPNGNWLKPSRAYSGVPITVPYEYYCDGHRVTGFQKYTLPENATVHTSGSLPSVIRIRDHYNNVGYRIESEKFDSVLTGVSIDHDPETGLYLDGCYNFNNGTVNIYAGNHCPITLEKNCLQHTAGTVRIPNNDNFDPIYFGENCCTNMDLEIVNNTYTSRVGANSFRNIYFGNEAVVGNIDPNCCVNMTEPLTFGNNSLVFCDLEPFILAHKDRCEELGIKVLYFENDCNIYNADWIKSRYGYYITYHATLSEVPRTSSGITME